MNDQLDGLAELNDLPSQTSDPGAWSGELAQRALLLRHIRRTLSTDVADLSTNPDVIDTLAVVDRVLVHLVAETEELESLANPEDLRGAVLRRIDQDSGELLAREWASVSKLDLRWQTVFDERKQFPSALATTAATSITTEQLTRYLRERQISKSSDIEVLSLVPLAGGKSKETMTVTLAGAPDLPNVVILRKDRDGPRSPLLTRASDEYELIQAVIDYGGVPCPRPIAAEPNPSVFGGTFMLMERAAGRRAGEYFFELGRPLAGGADVIRQLASALGRLHSMPPERLPRRPDGRAASDVTPSVEELASRVQATPGPSTTTFDTACRWLAEHSDWFDDLSGLVVTHGDVGLHNMLVDRTKLTALVDWELAGLGSAGLELSSIYDLVSHLTTWEVFTQKYTESGGNPDHCRPRSILALRLYRALWGYSVCRAHVAAFTEGARTDIVAAGSWVDSTMRHSRNILRALADAESSSPR